MAKSPSSLHLHPLKVRLSVIFLVEVLVVLHPRLVHVPVPRTRGHHRRLGVGRILLLYKQCSGSVLHHCHYYWQFWIPKYFRCMTITMQHQNDEKTAFLFSFQYCCSQSHTTHTRHWQLIRSKLGFYFSFGITLDIDVFFFGALAIDQSKMKHTKKLKEIPSRLFLENLPEKASSMPLYIWSSLAIYKDSANI